MKEYAEIIITGISVISGAFFAYHKFMSNYIDNMKRELIKDMKNDIKIDLQFIKERMFPK